MVTSLSSVYSGPEMPALAPMIAPSEIVGVTVTSPSYAAVTAEAVRRFRKHSGLDVIVLHSGSEPAFASKLNLDLLIAPKRIVFFDADWWILRDFDFSTLFNDWRWTFAAVPDPCAVAPRAFPFIDSEREGWNKSTYFNSGFFCCDLANAHIQRVFANARKHLADCHEGKAARPADWTDQYFLNWAVQRETGIFKPLGFEMNFFKLAVDWGCYPHIPREIIGLHGAGVPAKEKLKVLQQQAAVFGQPFHPL